MPNVHLRFVALANSMLALQRLRRLKGGETVVIAENSHPADTKKASTVISCRGYRVLRLGGAAKYNEGGYIKTKYERAALNLSYWLAMPHQTAA